MPNSRADRTAYLGLLALMIQGAETQGWSFPYWNQIQTDAALAALAQAVRDGTVRLVAPDAAPTVAISAISGSIPGSVGLEIAQTFVDEWGRETDAGPIATINTPAGIDDPDTAATLGTPTLGGASGFEGGLLEIWYSWTDGSGGETLPSPVVQVEVPYQAGGLLSEVEVILPSTPAAADAAGANIYIRHRSGNVVKAYICADDEDVFTLDGSVEDCYRSTPLVNSTGSINAIDITGDDPGEDGDVPVATRFYIRETGAAWTSGDRRLTLAGINEWDPATVTYPLLYSGSITELTAGFPPTVSQAKALRPLDLGTEVIGTVDASNLPPEAVLEAELILSTGAAVMSGLAVSAQGAPNMTVHVAAGTALQAGGRRAPAADDLTIPTADPDDPRIDIIVLADDGTVRGPTEDVALKGAPDPTPDPPSTPAGALLLAQVLVDEDVTEIVSGKITDERALLPTILAAVLEFRAADDVIAGDLSDHAADAVLHASKAHVIGDVETTCTGSSQTFTVTVPGPMLVTQLLVTVASGGVIDYMIELFEDSGRSVLAYQAGDVVTGLDAEMFQDRLPWEWFGGATMYGRITNNIAEDLTAIAIGVSYRL